MKEIANKLGLSDKGTESEGKYTFQMANSDDYSKVYSKLDKSDLVSLDEESVVLSEHIHETVYYGEGFYVRLVASFDEDIYTCEIGEE